MQETANAESKAALARNRFILMLLAKPIFFIILEVKSLIISYKYGYCI